MYEDEVCPRLHTLVTPWIVEIEHKALIQVRQLFFYFLDEALVHLSMPMDVQSVSKYIFSLFVAVG